MIPTRKCPGAASSPASSSGVSGSARRELVRAGDAVAQLPAPVVGSSPARARWCAGSCVRLARLRLRLVVDDRQTDRHGGCPQRHGDDGLVRPVLMCACVVSPSATSVPVAIERFHVTITGPVILRSSSTVKLVGSEIAVGVGRHRRTWSTAARRSRSPAAAPAPASRRRATSTSRNESSRWQAAEHEPAPPAATSGQDRRTCAAATSVTLRTCSCPTCCPAAAPASAGGTSRSPPTGRAHDQRPQRGPRPTESAAAADRCVVAPTRSATARRRGPAPAAGPARAAAARAALTGGGSARRRRAHGGGAGRARSWLSAPPARAASSVAIFASMSARLRRLRDLVEERAVVRDGALGVARAAIALAAIEQHDRIVELLVGRGVFVDRRLAVPLAASAFAFLRWLRPSAADPRRTLRACAGDAAGATCLALPHAAPPPTPRQTRDHHHAVTARLTDSAARPAAARSRPAPASWASTGCCRTPASGPCPP